MTPLTKIEVLDLEKKMKETFNWSAETTDKVIGKLAEIGVVLLKESKKQKFTQCLKNGLGKILHIV